MRGWVYHGNLLTITIFLDEMWVTLIISFFTLLLHFLYLQSPLGRRQIAPMAGYAAGERQASLSVCREEDSTRHRTSPYHRVTGAQPDGEGERVDATVLARRHDGVGPSQVITHPGGQ